MYSKPLQNRILRIYNYYRTELCDTLYGITRMRATLAALYLSPFCSNKM